MSKITLNGKSPQQLVFDIALDGERRESLAEVNSVAKLNPSITVERSLMRNLQPTVLQNMMHTALAMYISEYMQAFEITSETGGIRIIDVLAPLSDKPDKTFTIGISGEGWDEETLEFPQFGIKGESRKPDNDISRPSNLAVGKDFKVSLDISDKITKEITINATMAPAEANLEFLIDVMVNLNKNRDIISRWHDAWAGQISWFSDFLLNRDILKAERKLMIRDGEDGLYRESEMRRAAGLATAFLSKHEQLNVASNFVVLSTTGAARLASAAGGEITSYSARKSILRESGCMCMFIVDAIEERFTVYMRGIRRGKIYTFEDIKNFSKDADGIDINDLMASLSKGSF